MALYNSESEQHLGTPHSGTATDKGDRAVELSDEDVDILVKLIKEKGTTDVEELDLENLYPDIYKNLSDAYRDMAHDAKEMELLWEGFYSGFFDCDFYELMDYCEKNLGFYFFLNPKDYFSDEELAYFKENPESYEEIVDEAKSEAFGDWLIDYVFDLPDDEAPDFFYNQMHAKLNMDDVEYTVGIPQAIINKAKQ
jgi:hypothetical protein